MFGFSKKKAQKKANVPKKSGRETDSQIDSNNERAERVPDENTSPTEQTPSRPQMRASDRLNAMTPKDLKHVQETGLQQAEQKPQQPSERENPVIQENPEAAREKDHKNTLENQPPKFQQTSQPAQKNTALHSPEEQGEERTQGQREEAKKEPEPTLITPQDSSNFSPQNTGSAKKVENSPASFTQSPEQQPSLSKTQNTSATPNKTQSVPVPPNNAQENNAETLETEKNTKASFEQKPEEKRSASETPVSQPSESTQKSEPAKAVRTFESDLQQHATEAEQKQQAGKKKRTFTPKNILMVLGSIFFILGAFALIYFIVISFEKEPEVPTATPPLIQVEQTQEITINDSETQSALFSDLQNIKNAQLEEYSVRRIVPVRTTQTTEEPIRIIESPVKPINFLAALGAEVPPSLRENLTEEATFGVYATSEENEPFIILKTNAYENAFSGMLSWEKTLVRKFSEWFNLGIVNEDTVIRAENLVIENRDVRKLFDRNAEPLLFYAFRDQSTIVITPDRSTLKTLLRRLDNAQ